MSQENVEIVRRARERGHGDAEFFSPDVVYRPIAIWADSQECRGLAELRRFGQSVEQLNRSDFVTQLILVALGLITGLLIARAL